MFVLQCVYANGMAVMVYSLPEVYIQAWSKTYQTRVLIVPYKIVVDRPSDIPKQGLPLQRGQLYIRQGSGLKDSIGFDMSFCSWRGEEYYRDHFVSGIYQCAECGNDLFSSLSKYQHDTPWPAFTRPIRQDSLKKIPEEGRPLALKVSCGNCGNGLGHEFLKDRDDGGSRF